MNPQLGQEGKEMCICSGVKLNFFLAHFPGEQFHCIEWVIFGFGSYYLSHPQFRVGQKQGRFCRWCDSLWIFF